MNLNECFKDFKNYLSAEKNATKSTIDSYNFDFKFFLEFLETNGIEPELEKITTVILRRYFSHLKIEKKYKNQTLRRKIHSLSSFFKFVIEQEYIIKNPMACIHAPKQEQKIPVYLNKSEIDKLINAAWKNGKENALRDKCFLKALAHTGIRRKEALALNWQDIDFGKSIMKIQNGKGKKDRLLPLTESLSTDLWAYLQTRLPLEDQPAVFVSSTGHRLTVGPAQNIFTKYLKMAGLQGKGYTIHKLRHSYASLLVQQDVDILSVKELLGHADLNSTKIYAHLNMKYLKEQVEKLPFD